MANVAREEAGRIRVTQAARRRAFGEEAHAGQIAKADAFDDIADLILTIIPVKAQVAALLAPIAGARAKSAGNADPPEEADATGITDDKPEE